MAIKTYNGKYQKAIPSGEVVSERVFLGEGVKLRNNQVAVVLQRFNAYYSSSHEVKKFKVQISNIRILDDFTMDGKVGTFVLFNIEVEFIDGSKNKGSVDVEYLVVTDVY